MRPLASLLLAALLWPLSGPARACTVGIEPTPPAANPQQEVQRINALLGNCERARINDPDVQNNERKFFTWAQGVRIDRLRTRPPIEYCAYIEGRDTTRILHGISAAYQADWANPAIRDAVAAIGWQNPRDLDALDALSLATTLSNPKGITAANFAAAKEIASWRFAYPEFTTEVLETTPQARTEALAAQFEEYEDAQNELDVLNPQIDALEDRLEALHWPVQQPDDLQGAPAAVVTLYQQIAPLNSRAQEQLQLLNNHPLDPPLAYAYAEGELEVLQALVAGNAGLQTNAYGIGAYFSTDPFAWIQLFASVDHAGLVCDFGANGAPTVRVVDLYASGNIEGMEQNRVLLPPLPERLHLRGTNSFYHPRAFARASQGRFLAFRGASPLPIYLDRCGFNYQGNLCRLFQISDLSCQQAEFANDAINNPAQHTGQRAVQVRNAFVHLRLVLRANDEGGEQQAVLNQRCGTNYQFYSPTPAVEQ